MSTAEFLKYPGSCYKLSGQFLPEAGKETIKLTWSPHICVIDKNISEKIVVVRPAI